MIIELGPNIMNFLWALFACQLIAIILSALILK